MWHQVQGLDRFAGPTGATLAAIPLGSTSHGLFFQLSVLMLVVSLFGLTGCGSTPTRIGQSDDAEVERILGHGGQGGLGEDIARTALQMRGVPYLWGGVTPAGFDCSGLVYYSYAKAGIQVPRSSRAQYAAAMNISPEQARPGDLLFFVNHGNWHVGISLGGDKFVHAPQTGSLVSISSLGYGHYRENLVAVGRLVPGAGGSPDPRNLVKASDTAGTAKMTPAALELSRLRTQVAQLKREVGVLR